MMRIVLMIGLAVLFTAAWLSISLPSAERPESAARTDHSVPPRPPPMQAPPAVDGGRETMLQTVATSGEEQSDPVFDPMLVTGLGRFTEEEIARYNRLHLLPFNPAIGRSCEDRPDPDFPGRSYTRCTTEREHPAHPYGELDEEALLSLAEHDAVAALMLGRRVAGEDERLYWYLRAAALSEKSGPLMALAEQRYATAMDLRVVDGKLRRVPRPDRMAVRVALDTVAGRMGDPRANPERWRVVLRSLAADRAPTYLAQADALVAEFLGAMARTQREITGSVQIQEIIDNA
jgi:hypothetical protein